jgi:NAD-dependent dihydropyrimidine dehydrogenase PreA subunit
VLYPSAVDLGDGKMAFVITEPCVGVKDASCTEVCPVDCIHTTEEDNMFYINPDDCIDCAYCESVCPVNAIFDEFTVPANWRGYVQKNREYFKKK